MRTRWATLGVALAVVDPAAVVVATLVSSLVGGADLGWGPVVLGAEAAFLVTLATGRQSSRLALSLRRDLPVLGLATVAATGTLVLASDVLVLDAGAGWLKVGSVAVLIFAYLVLGRAVAHGVTRLLRLTRRFARGVVLVGTGDVGRQVAEGFATRPDLGLVPVGFVDCGSRSNARGLPLPFLGGLDALPIVLAENDDADVVFCCDARPDEATEDVLRECLRPPRRIYVAPGQWQRVAGRGRFEQVGDVRLVRLQGWPRPRRRRTAKRKASAAAPRADHPQVHAGQLAG